MEVQFILLLVVAAGWAVDAGLSPHADLVDRMFKAEDYSDNIWEDAHLDVPDLVRKYKYPIEVHRAITSDGYILEMHRIPHGRDQNNDPQVRRPIVFVMHGLTSSSADWLILGPGKALAYILAEEGFDVWLGNARGNYYSRRHTSLNPDDRILGRFWDFSWHEIGNIDLATMIDYALVFTGQSALHYIGHSQGTTSFFVLASTRPEYNRKILSMHAFAPVAYMSNSYSPIFLMMAPRAEEIWEVAKFMGMYEFVPKDEMMHVMASRFCADDVATQPLCMNMLFLIAGGTPEQLNATLLPIKMGHTPAGSSGKQFVHYGQLIESGFFRQYDYGSVRNRLTYGSRNPPDYPVSQISAPVFLHYTLSDPLAGVPDVLQLAREIGSNAFLMKVPLDAFGHIDFMWGVDARELLWDRAINIMKSISG